MSAEENRKAIIARAEKVFSTVKRPQHFTNHRHCCECQEHDEELQPFTPADIPRAALGHMGWDPITFCTDEGFRYFLPGMIRIVMTETGEDNYYHQFLWQLTWVHKDCDRFAICSIEERKVVLAALEWLLEHRADEIEEEYVSEELFWAIERWSGSGKADDETKMMT